MATRGRPKKEQVHKVSYYTPKAKVAQKAYQKVIEERLKKGYTQLFTFAKGEKPNQADVHTINVAVKQGLKLL